MATIYILYFLGFLFVVWAQFNVTLTIGKYAKIKNSKGITGKDLLFWFNKTFNTNIKLEVNNSWLGEYYDPIHNKIVLSNKTANTATISSLAVTAHELGHALQKYNDYPFLKLRNFTVRFANIGSYLGYILIMLGLMLNSFNLASLGLVLFSFVLFFTLITLPVEINASKRALAMLKKYNILTSQELPQAKKVLTAAALTYVAALLVALLDFLRYLFIVLNLRNRD